jgi:hypothetical protein
MTVFRPSFPPFSLSSLFFFILPVSFFYSSFCPLFLQHSKSQSEQREMATKHSLFLIEEELSNKQKVRRERE